MKRIANHFYVVTLGVILFACGGTSSNSSENESTLSGEIKIDGSSTVYPITEAIAEEFRVD
jgi:phosphate transport system substrate-binding protein